MLKMILWAVMMSAINITLINDYFTDIQFAPYSIIALIMNTLSIYIAYKTKGAAKTIALLVYSTMSMLQGGFLAIYFTGENTALPHLITPFVICVTIYSVITGLITHKHFFLLLFIFIYCEEI